MTEAEIAAFFRQSIKAAKAAGKQASVPTVVRGNVTELSEVTGSHVVVVRAPPSGEQVLVPLALLTGSVADALAGEVTELDQITRSQRGPVGALLNALPAVEVAKDPSRGTRGRLVVRRNPTWQPEPIDLTDLPELEQSAIEGRRITVEHLRYERSSKLVAEKKRSVEPLRCEVCSFDFAETYGELGAGVCEVHHRDPLHTGQRETTLSDLAVLCANCHRILHRSGTSVSALKLLVERRR